MLKNSDEMYTNKKKYILKQVLTNNSPQEIIVCNSILSMTVEMHKN